MATKIYIDQGHNPQNPNAGAEGSGYREQDLVYEIGVQLADILDSLGFETRLSRNDPEEVLGTSNQSSLQARVNDANAWGADYFLSLHTNAAASPSASGTEALVYSLGSPAEPLAESILTELNLATGLRNRGVIARPGLYVLRRTKMPAILLELGFITNRNDADLMANSPEIFAEGIASGIVNYLGVPVFRPVLNHSTRATPPTDPILKETTEPPENSEPLPGPNDDESATDEDSETPGGLSYTDFIKENPATGYLKVQAFRGDQVYPVSGVQIIVSREFDDGERVFFAGATDENGIIDLIPLPAPPRKNSLTPGTPDKYTDYDLRAVHPEYNSIRTKISVYEGVRTLQPLLMIIK